MLRAALGMSVAIGAVACQQNPAFTLEGPSDAAASVQRVTVTAGMTDLGSDTDELCVIQSIGQLGLGVPAVDDDASVDSDAADLPGADAGAAQIQLYFDIPTGHWHVIANGPASATIACAPWSAFGGPQPLTRLDNGGGNAAGSGSAYLASNGGNDCFLSNVEGDFSAPGNGAALVDGGFTVTDPALDGIYASAICFGTSRPVPFTDVAVDARSGTLDVALPSEGEALCGLAALDSLGAPTSSIAISGGQALGTQLRATVRCFSFVTKSDSG